MIMDDLDGLFSSPAPQGGPTALSAMPGATPFTNSAQFPNNQVPIMASPMMQQQPQQFPPQMQGFPQMPAMQMQAPAPAPAPTLPMTPTQTTEASQLNNKTQILNQFQYGQPAPASMGGIAPPRPAPAIPPQQQVLGQPQQQQQQQFVAQQQQQQQPVPDPFLQSMSVTEPGPVEFDDMFGGGQQQQQQQQTAQPDDNVDGTVGGSTFFIEDGNKEQAPATEDVSEDTEKKEDGADKSEESNPSERKTSFWQGLWNRNKDQGSKENIIEDSATDDGKCDIL